MIRFVRLCVYFSFFYLVERENDRSSVEHSPSSDRHYWRYPVYRANNRSGLYPSLGTKSTRGIRETPHKIPTAINYIRGTCQSCRGERRVCCTKWHFHCTCPTVFASCRVSSPPIYSSSSSFLLPFFFWGEPLEWRHVSYIYYALRFIYRIFWTRKLERNCGRYYEGKLRRGILEVFVLFSALSFFMSILSDDSQWRYFIFRMYLPIASLFSEMIRRGARTTRVGKRGWTIKPRKIHHFSYFNVAYTGAWINQREIRSSASSGDKWHGRWTNDNYNETVFWNLSCNFRASSNCKQAA